MVQNRPQVADAASHVIEDTRMASQNVIELTEANWNEHVTSGVLLVADFWAPWCGPCRALSPTIDRIADQFAGKVKVGKLNVDENPNIAVKYDVMTIPRILFFKGGDTPVHQEVGVISPDDLANLVTKFQGMGS
jgi:thioredoxin 1